MLFLLLETIMIDIDVVLRDHGLRKTAFRNELLSMFYTIKSSLTAEEIKSKVETAKDKVTIYRALEAFEKSGLIHRVPDKSNLTRYALCHNDCNAEQHIHNHAHFICNSCKETFCIDTVQTPEIESMNGFLIKKAKLILEGDCSDCREKEIAS